VRVFVDDYGFLDDCLGNGGGGFGVVVVVVVMRAV